MEQWAELRRVHFVRGVSIKALARGTGLSRNTVKLTNRQAKLAQIQRTNERLYRAYLLKEQLRMINRLPAAQAIALLDHWIESARRRLKRFVKLADDHRPAGPLLRRPDTAYQAPARLTPP